MARLTPEEYAEKQATRLKAAAEDIRRGLSRVQQAPGELAVRKQDKLLAKFQESVSSGRWAAATRSVSLGEWQELAIQKGVPRIAAGIDAARPKQVAMAQRLLAAVDQAAAKARSLPDATLEDSINRAATYMREMAKNKGRIKAGG